MAFSSSVSVTQRVSPDLESLDPRLFSQDFDALKNLWDTLPNDFDTETMNKLLNQLQIQQNQVNTVMYGRVMAQYDAMGLAIKRMEALAASLKEAREIAKESRGSVQGAKQTLGMPGLHVMALYEQRERHDHIRKVLHQIAVVINMEETLKQALGEGNFKEAIALCIKCGNLIEKYPEFECLKGMKTIFTKHYADAKSKVDTELGNSCQHPFVPSKYQRAIEANQLMRKSQRVVQHLCKHFSRAISAATKNTLIAHALMDTTNLEKAEDLKKLKVRGLVKFLKEPKFVSCFQLILEQMSDIMYCNYEMINFNSARSQLEGIPAQSTSYYKELFEGLSQNKTALWDEIQRNVTVLCSPTTLICSFQLEDFLLLLDNVNTLINIGEQFTKEPAHKLRGVVKQISKAYFDDFHKNRLENLRNLLEEETWERCPVPSRFGMNDITDLNSIIKKISEVSRVVSFESPLNVSVGNANAKGNRFFENYAKLGNPFLPKQKETSNGFVEDVPLDTKDNEPDKTTKSQNRRRRQSEFGPLLTTTTINVVKMIAKYLEMMTALSHISWDVFQGLMQVYQMYYYSIISFFGSSAGNISGSRVDSEAKKLLEEVIQAPLTDSKPNVPSHQLKIHHGIKLNSKVETNASSLYGLLAMAVAAESLLFVKQSLDLIQPHLPGFLPKTNHQALTNFFTISVNTVPQVHHLLYKGICNKFISAQVLIPEIQNVNWKTKDIPMYHSPYVNTISKNLTEFSKKFNTYLDSRSASSKIEDQMWTSMISHVCDCIIEGFAMPQCTPEGRAMMGIDLQNIENIVTGLKINDMKPIFQGVDVYIKAFYLPGDELEEWTRTHTEYTPNQRSALINAGEWDVNVKKKALRVLNK